MAINTDSRRTYIGFGYLPHRRPTADGGSTGPFVADLLLLISRPSDQDGTYRIEGRTRVYDVHPTDPNAPDSKRWFEGRFEFVNDDAAWDHFVELMMGAMKLGSADFPDIVRVDGGELELFEKMRRFPWCHLSPHRGDRVRT